MPGAGTRIALTASALAMVAFGTYSWFVLEEADARRRQEIERQALDLGNALTATIQHVGFSAFAADRDELYAEFRARTLPWRVTLLERGGGADAIDPATEERLRDLVTLDRPLLEEVAVDGQPTLVYAQPIREVNSTPGLGDRVVGAVQLSRELDFLAEESAERKRQALLSMTLVLALLTVGIYWVARGGVGRPLRKLLAGMDDVARGDLSHVLLQERDDEIGALAARFNTMTASLREARLETQRGMTAKLTLEHQLAASEKLATVGGLAAEIAHEVGTPLNVVTGRARAMARRADDPEAVRKNARIIAEQATRITRIIQRLLDFARRGAREVETVPVDLNVLVDGCLEFLEDQIAKNRVTTELALDRDLPELPAHRDQLQQVLLNLVVNALQAMPGGGRLRIETDRVHRRRPGLEMAPEHEYAVLVITDTGVGIPRALKARIFEPFATSREDRGGTGLGLAVSQGIVKDHDGWIEFDSPVHQGSGTCFRVYLPLETEPRLSEVTGQRDAAPPGPPGSGTGSGDDPDDGT